MYILVDCSMISWFGPFECKGQEIYCVDIQIIQSASIITSAIHALRLAHDSSRWTEGSRQYLDGFQYGGKHGSGLLPKTSLCRCGLITACEQEVVNSRQAYTLPRVVEASPLVVS